MLKGSQLRIRKDLSSGQAYISLPHPKDPNINLKTKGSHQLP